MVKPKTNPIPDRSSPGSTRAAQTVQALRQVANSGLSDPTGDVAGTRQTQEVELLEPQKRKQWSKEENKALMKCYYTAEKSGRGYMKRLLENWRLIYPESTMTAQALAVRKRAIITQKLLTQVELAEIEQLVTMHGEQEEQVEEQEQEKDAEYQTPENLQEIPDEHQEGPIELDQDLKNEILTELQIINGSQHRTKIPLLMGRKGLSDLVTKADAILSTLKFKSITALNEVIHATARAIAKRVGIKLDQEQRQRSNQQDPPWLHRLTKKLEQQRREVNQLQTIKRGARLRNKETQARLLAKYHVPERSIQSACEDAKQRLIALAAKIDKYKSRVKQFQQNRMFQLNQRQFYKNLENPGGTIKVNDTPNNSEEMARFWQDIWSQEKKHNQQATWIQTVKDTQNDTQEQ